MNKKIILTLAILSLITFNVRAEDLPPLPDLPSSGSAKLSDLKLPATPSVPTLPPITPLPSSDEISLLGDKKEVKAKETKVAKIEEKEAISENTEQKKPKGKKGKKGKKKAKDEAKSASKRLAFVIKDRLPAEIYKKGYDPENRHLPIVYYEKEYDNLVFLTAMHDDVDGLRAMLDSGRSVNLINSAGDTPLIAGVKNNSVRAVKLLLMRDADARITDRNGFTALQIANSIGNNKMKRVFVGLD
ncbi:MAG: ankyrin repeat domain-containing protein [Pseudomonadota bacterium]